MRNVNPTTIGGGRCHKSRIAATNSFAAVSMFPTVKYVARSENRNLSVFHLCSKERGAWTSCDVNNCSGDDRKRNVDWL